MAAFCKAHPDTLSSMKRYGEIQVAALGESHLDTRTGMNNYGLSLSPGRLDSAAEAAEINKRCWELQVAALGESHPDALHSMYDYGNARVKLDRVAEGAELFRR